MIEQEAPRNVENMGENIEKKEREECSNVERENQPQLEVEADM